MRAPTKMNPPKASPESRAKEGDKALRPNVVDIFLQPGEFYFGDRETRIRTVLGSCVSITMWHPQLLIGGMCHYMLPFRGMGGARPRLDALDGKYAEEAILLFFQEAVRHDTDPANYVVKVFGGGNMFPHLKNTSAGCGVKLRCDKLETCSNVPCKNATVIYYLAKQYGFQIAAAHTGGDGHRQVLFDVGNGDVWVRQAPIILRTE